MDFLSVGEMDLAHTASLLRISILLMFFFDYSVSPLELLELRVPAHVPLGTRAALSCRWALGPADVLYSVKWYKDGKEFFRHVPRDREPRRRFPLPGVDVEEVDVLASQLTLSPVTLESSGRYRCEVSGEGPLFPTVTKYADMDVVALPEHGPIITGFNSKYLIGDGVHIDCTSGRSRPATQLSWYINGEPLPIDKYTLKYKSENSLIVTISTLDFEVTEKLFKNTRLKVKCLAIITPIYWKSNEESAVLEYTSTLYPNLTLISNNQKIKRTERDHSAPNMAQNNFADNFSKSWLFFGVFFAKLYCS